MSSEDDFVTANAQSNAELGTLVARLSDSGLGCNLGEGWTVVAMLAHLAFYDFRAAALLDRWRASGVIAASPLDADLLNAANEHLLLAVPPRRAAALAIEAADPVHHRVAAINSDFLDRLQAFGRPALTLHRSEHRRGHVTQVEQALAK